MKNNIILKAFEYHLADPFLLKFGETCTLNTQDFRSVLAVMNLHIKLTGNNKIQEGTLIRAFQDKGLLPKDNYKKNDYFIFQSTKKSAAELESERIESNRVSDRFFLLNQQMKNIAILEEYLDDGKPLDFRCKHKAIVELSLMKELNAKAFRLLPYPNDITIDIQVVNDLLDLFINHRDRYVDFNNKYIQLSQ